MFSVSSATFLPHSSFFTVAALRGERNEKLLLLLVLVQKSAALASIRPHWANTARDYCYDS